MRKKLALDYLRVLAGHSQEAAHIVDKSPANADYLGLIHGVFPNARIIYLRRDPIDTCLSCYFQQFSQALSFTMDLSDLAHYYREHQRLVAHWRSALPPGTLLDVPYSELVADQENWCERPEDPDRYQGSHEQQRSYRTGVIAGEGDPFTKADHRQVQDEPRGAP